MQLHNPTTVDSTTTSNSIQNPKTESLLQVMLGMWGAIIAVSLTLIILCVMLRQKRHMNRNKPGKLDGQTTVYNHMTRLSTARMSLQTVRYDDTYDNMDDVTCDHMDSNLVNITTIRISNEACHQRKDAVATVINQECDPEYDLAVLNV